jgi:phosphate transport system substrate-binding protein
MLAEIYLGQVKRWDAPRLQKENPGVRLPRLPITVVHRSDGSGTTFLFTTYLAGVDGAWKAGPGANDSVNWPVGQGGKGNDGVAAFVHQTVGSIGYVEYFFAKRSNLTYLASRRRRPSPPRRPGRTGRRLRASICCCSISRRPRPGRSPAPPSS